MRRIVVPAGSPPELARLATDINLAMAQLQAAQIPASYTVATLPTADIRPGTPAYVTDETGGAVPAFFDGTNWRRVTDRAVCS